MEDVYELEKFKSLSSYFCELGESIFDLPINGELKMLHVMISIYEKKFAQETVGRYTLEQFVDYLHQFDCATGFLLEFVGDSRLKEINLVKIELFRKKLDNSDETNTKLTKSFKMENISGSTKSQLLRLIEPEKELKLDTKVKLLEPLVHFSNKTFKDFVDYESACVILNKRRAKVRATKMPFYEVCGNANHNKVLSNVCLSRKDFHGGSKQTFPSWEQCLQAIKQYQKLFSPEVYQCSKNKIHYLPIITNFTDVSLGDCSYLDTCHKMRTCRYLHYFSLYPKPLGAKQVDRNQKLFDLDYSHGFSFMEYQRTELPPQWINCDVRYLPFLILGKFAVILSDPAWDIHMALPYGTCRDLELLSLPMHELQDEGIMLLWVTGRSIDVGRQALNKWGYQVSDEMIWVKLNQLKRTIVTGRTGHWLNHSKEHLLIGIKGDPEWLNRAIDVNVVVSGTRETSRKPDEIYGIVERLVGPYARKLEFFGRDHNVRPGWLTIGNQLLGTNLYERDVKERYEAYQKLSRDTKSQPK